ncbi:MAG: flagellar biosynthesis repressor FlbT [Pseudomonadota bacterium]
MPGLILKLRAHEQILVNGVVMQNGERNTRLIIKTPDAKILRLRDAIHPDEVNTPVKRVCYIAQLVVAGEAAPDKAAPELERGLTQLREALKGVVSCQPLDDARRELARGNFYGCLRQLRQLLPVEERLLGRPAESPQADVAASPRSASNACGGAAEPLSAEEENGRAVGRQARAALVNHDVGQPHAAHGRQGPCAQHTVTRDPTR